MQSKTEMAPATGTLRGRFGDTVVTAADEGYDAARAAFNLLVDQRPEAVVRPGSAPEAAELVRAVAGAGLRIAPQGSAHNAGPLGALDATAIFRLDRMTNVEIDAGAQIARVEAGARWWDVVPAAAEHGLSALHGSSPEINVVGYSLGGGVGWQGRKRGLQANSLTAIEVVTADGELRRADADHEPGLFWGLRGGGGNFGLVTAVEFRLYPLATAFAGSLFFDYERSAEVFHAWHEWTAGLPEELTSAIRMLQFPPMEEIPEMVRGKSFAIVGATFLGDEAAGAELIEPLRALGPQMDTFGTVPAAALTELHMDPFDPVPYASTHAMLGDLPVQAIDDVITAAGPGTGSMLTGVELRHLGGALGRAPADAGAIDALRGEYLGFAFGAVMGPDMAPAIEAQIGAVAAAFAPYETGRYLNFTEQPHDVEEMFGPGVVERLRAIRSEYDPEGVFKANHAV
jgi:FAD/FMN-containing dehydrogenase